MGHAIHKHMHSSSMKSAEKYDAKEAYNKDLTSKARLHYLENNIADHKGMSRADSDYGDGPMEFNKGLKAAQAAGKLTGEFDTLVKNSSVSRKASPANNYDDDSMSRKASPVNNISFGDKSGITGYMGDRSQIAYNEGHVPQREMAAGKKSPYSRKKDY